MLALQDNDGIGGSTAQNPTAAFPIMMGSCAFLMPVGGLRFVREGSYDLRTAVGLTLGGIPGVLLAAYFVVNMPLYAVRWLVIAVVIYTSIQMLWQRTKAHSKTSA